MDGLQRELALSHSLLGVLSNWPGDGPAFLFIDALDATRGGRSEAVFRAVIAGALALPGGRWRVVASIRTFDLKLGHQFRELFAGQPPDPAFTDPTFSQVRHVLVPPWSRPELAELLARAPALETAIRVGGPRLLELAQVPFNTKLLADLINNGVEPAAYGEINSQVELLGLYWSRRVVGLGSSADIALQAVVSQMVEQRALRARKLDAARANPEALDGLLAANVLIPLGSEQQFVVFRHHILFDYAASRLYLRLDNLETTLPLLDRGRGLGLMLAPALAFALRGLWVDSDAGHRQFWDAVVGIVGDKRCDPIARSVSARTASELPQLRDDMGGLLAALGPATSRNSAATAFGHIVGALAVRADDRERIAAAPWCALAADVVVDIEHVLYPLRTLVFLMVSRTETDGQGAEVGRASRAVLSYGLDHPETSSQIIAASIDFVADTYVTDIPASRALLRRLLEPDRFAAHADQELPWLARKMAPIGTADPDFVVEVYAAIFGGQIHDTSKTSIGQSSILPLLSSRDQDYDMARFGLKEYFPHFLESRPMRALTALQRAMSGYIAQKHPPPGEAKSWTIAVDGREARLRADESHIWAWNPDETHPDNTIDLLRAFVARLRGAEPAVARAMVEHVIEHNNVAVIWARTFLVAAERPDVVGDLLWPFAIQEPFLQCADTTKDAVDFVATRYPSEPEREREGFERAASVFDFSWSREPEAARNRFLQRVFGRIGLPNLVLAESRAFVETQHAAGGRPSENRRPFMIKSGFVEERDPYWWLTEAGVDTKERKNASLLKKTDQVKDRLKLEPPSNDHFDIGKAITILQRLHRGIASASVDPRVADHANGILGRGAAKVLGRPIEQLRATADAVHQLAPLVVYLVDLTAPPPGADAEAAFERNASWGFSPKIDAATSIMRLMQFDPVYLARFRATVETLLADAEPAVRLQVGDRLTVLWDADREWMWQLADRIVREETNRGVLKFFVNDLLNRLVHHAPEQVETLAFILGGREFPREEAPTQSLLEEIGSITAILWMSHGRERAKRALESWLADPPTHRPELGHAINVSREALILKYREGDERSAAITRRAQEFAAWTVEATASGVERYLASVDPSESEKQRAGIFAQLLNNMSDQFYFASGAFQESQGQIPALATTEAKAAFLQDNYATLRRIADAGTPPTIFHLIELLEFLIPADPERVFDLVAHALLGAGQRHQFQFESLGADRFVGLVGRFLADHRPLFADDGRRDQLVACLDVFMEAGWPAARRLLYRLPELLQ